MLEAVFVPSDPPRHGVLALWDGTGMPRLPEVSGSNVIDRAVEMIVPSGHRVRRAKIPAKVLPMADALRLLTSRERPVDTNRSFDAWCSAALAGLGLIARGRLLPGMSETGYGSWRVGPLDPEDHAWLRKLAEAMPPSGHAIPIDGTRPLQVERPETLIRAFWNAIADTIVRTPAARVVAGASAFTDVEPIPLSGDTTWLEDSERAEAAGARVVLRIDVNLADDLFSSAGDADEETGGFQTRTGVELPAVTDVEGYRGVLQLRSVADPSLFVDVADLWTTPSFVLSRFGERAEADLVLGLRRGAKAWPPLGATLQAATPTGIDLTDDDLDELLSDGAQALDSAGIEVLWPKELFADGLSLKATTSTSTPTGGVTGMLDLEGMLKFRWQPMLGGDALTEEEMQALADAKRPFLMMRGRLVRVDKDLLAKLRKRRTRQLTGAEALAASLAGELEVDGEIVEFAANGALKDLASLVQEKSKDQDLAPSPELLATLRPYQRKGLAWLAHLTDIGLGACLADDMGLGKTLQLIALHLHRKPLDAGPTLVVCPTTLLGTWQREIEKFAPGTVTRRYHGGERSLADVGPHEVVLTSYGVVRRDHELLAETGWGLMVADEAQHAKNPLSRTARALRQVPATARVALTGTPVENRLSELWSILDWTTPGLLGTLDRFNSRLAVPVERYRDPDATARLSAITRPFLLRRKKTDPGIAPELPAKTESDVFVPLTTEQASIYKAVVDENMAEIAEAAGIARQGLVLKLLTGLKQICNHPAQYLHEKGPLRSRSGKLAALDELLDVILAEGESVLIFSQYVEMNRLLEAHLASRGIKTGFLHGGIGLSKRDKLVASFQAGEFPVFLLSLKAAGVGLTLTQATHVIHYDRWWNPAVEDQATDRAYRIGQDKSVQVHRLVAEGTLEDRIAALINAKRELAEAVVGSGEGWIGELSNDELSELVTLGGPR